MKIYGYARVSTAGQLEGYSIGEQEKAIKSYYNNAEIITESYSGAKKRAKFEKMVEDACNGDIIVTTKLDRFCRQTKEGLEYIERLMDKGVKVHILNMGIIENTPIGKMIVTQLLAFAEFERAMIVERTQAGKREAKEKMGDDWNEGRPKIKIDENKFKELQEKVKKKEITVSKASKVLGISVRTWYNRVNLEKENV